MVHRSQVLVNHSSTIILSHTTLHVFYRLIFLKYSSYDQVAFIDIQYLVVAPDQFFFGQVAFIDIQYLVVAPDQFFFGQDQVTSDELS
jgi:hypothetical protein